MTSLYYCSTAIYAFTTDLESCKQIDDLAICSIAKGNPHLKVININNCNKIGDVAMVALGLNCHELISLSMAHCYKISNRGVEELSEGTPRLQSLNLTSCRLVDEHCLLKLCTNSTVISLLVLDNLQSHFKIETLHSIRHLLHFATVASTFYGLKPIDDILYAKLKAQQKFFKDGAATHIQCVLRTKLAKNHISRVLFNLQNNAAKVLGKRVRVFILRKRLKDWSKEFKEKTNAANIINSNVKIVLAKHVSFFKN